MARFVDRVWACNTITGDKLGIVPVSAFDWSRVINGGGSGRVTILVNEERTRKLDLSELVQEVKTTLVLESYDTVTKVGDVIAAGIVVDTDYDKDAGSWQLGHADLWWILALRLAIEHGPNNSEKTILSWTGLSLGTIIKRLLQEATWPDRSWYALPLALPADVVGADARKYFGYNYATIADAIRDLMEVSGGPDVDFHPRWDGNGRLQWQLRTGSLAGSTWEYNLDAAKVPATGVKRKTSADRMTTNAYSIGEGSEKNMLVRSHPNLDPTIPAMERTVSYKSEKVPANLSLYAEERIRALSKHTEQWAMKTFKDGTAANGELVEGLPKATDFRLGDTINLFSKKDPVLPKGLTKHRLIQLSGSITDSQVQLQFQPTGE